jgi:glycolate oxidase FAD binding subunit
MGTSTTHRQIFAGLEADVKTTTNTLPISGTVAANTAAEVGEIVRDAAASATAVYPLGGETSLDFGLPAKRSGVGLSLAPMNRVVDYPARDMTITVEPGVTMRSLAETLAHENQFLPIDVPHADRATIGGVIATNWNGPRRYGQGPLRDYVIGISAVDGTGRAFKGGGRVVKNVAGYDFCKLLTGSFGTLGVITQITLRVKPLPQRSTLLVARAKSLGEADKLLASLTSSPVTPVAIELLAGPAWASDAIVGDVLGGDARAAAIAVGLEGSQQEVSWMVDELGRQWQSAGVEHYVAVVDSDAVSLWKKLAEFPQTGKSPLVLKASLVASQVTNFALALRALDSNCSIQSHAGNGIVIARFAEIPAVGVSRMLLQTLVPLAAPCRGNVQVLAYEAAGELSRTSYWGTFETPLALMSEVKRQFDPRNILNADRFLFP